MEGAGKSRRELWTRVEEPDAVGIEYIVKAWFRVGMVDSGAMGQAPLRWSEVLAFAKATAAVSEPWEMEALVDMSRYYLHERVAAENPLRKSPMERDIADG